MITTGPRKGNKRVVRKNVFVPKRLQVSFDDRVETHYLPVIDDVGNLWYKNEEYQQIAKANKILLLKKMGHPKVAHVQLGEVCMRGLPWQLPERREKQKVMYRVAIAAVVLRRKRSDRPPETPSSNSSSSPHDDLDKGSGDCCHHYHQDETTNLSQSSIDVLSNIYSRLCTSSAAAAHVRGEKDAIMALGDVEDLSSEDEDSQDEFEVALRCLPQEIMSYLAQPTPVEISR